MNKGLLLKALTSIKDEPERFNMEYIAAEWVYVGGEKVYPDFEYGNSVHELLKAPTCNTTFCLAGWVLHHAYLDNPGSPVPTSLCVSRALDLLCMDTGSTRTEDLRDIMCLDSPYTINSPESLVAALEDIGVLEPREFEVQDD